MIRSGSWPVGTAPRGPGIPASSLISQGPSSGSGPVVLLVLPSPGSRYPLSASSVCVPFIPRSPPTPTLLQSRAPFSLPSLGHLPSPPPWGISESGGQEAGREGPPGEGEEGKWGEREGGTIRALTGGMEARVVRRPQGLTAPHSLHTPLQPGPQGTKCSPHSPLQPSPQGTECSPHTPQQPGPQGTQRPTHRASGLCERPRASQVQGQQGPLPPSTLPLRPPRGLAPGSGPLFTTEPPPPSALLCRR